jgi:hypothetical protein
VSIDDTAALLIVQPAPQAIAAASEESETEALVAELSDRLAGVRVLAPSRGDKDARIALREEIARMVATAQQLDGHLLEADRVERDAAHDAAFEDWRTAPGGTR